MLFCLHCLDYYSTQLGSGVINTLRCAAGNGSDRRLENTAELSVFGIPYLALFKCITDEGVEGRGDGRPRDATLASKYNIRNPLQNSSSSCIVWWLQLDSDLEDAPYGVIIIMP